MEQSAKALAPLLSKTKLARPTVLNLGVTLIIVSIYCVLFYLVLTFRYRLDFSSFYTACQTLSSGENPYRVLLTTYLPTVKKLSANLNPPALLLLFTPFSWLNYSTGVALWSIISFTLGLIGAELAYQHALPTDLLKKYRISLYLIYLSFFAVLMNTAIAQFGCVLLFFTMYGYHLFLKKNNWGTGIIWGTIIAIKLFPALLLFYVWSQKRYQLFTIMTGVFIVLSGIPLLLYGSTIYVQYFSMMSKVLWYGDSWNASLYGFIFRLLVDTQHLNGQVMIAELFYLILFCIFLFWYWDALKKPVVIDRPEYGFCLSLSMMLFLSPFGWFYYFSLLIYPLLLTWLRIMNEKEHIQRNVFIWLICLFLINFPSDYVRTHNMASFYNKIGIYSVHFYGLLLLIYLINKMAGFKNKMKTNINEIYAVPGMFVILSFSLCVLIISFVSHFLHAF